MPYILGDIAIETQERRESSKGESRLVVITVEEWEVRMKACEVMVKLLNRKSKLLGLDQPAKVEATKIFPPETPEQQATAREVLRKWTRFDPRPEDFQSTDLE